MIKASLDPEDPGRRRNGFVDPKNATPGRRRAREADGELVLDFELRRELRRNVQGRIPEADNAGCTTSGRGGSRCWSNKRRRQTGRRARRIIPPPYKALVSPITKDPTTSLYTIPSTTGARRSSTSPPPHLCNTSRPPSDLYKPHCNCTAYPVNPVTGLCAPADLTLTTVTANATDGKNPKYSIAFSDFVSSCSIKSLLQSLPASASGVVGLGRSELSLPQQLSTEAKYANKFALCLPGGGIGVAFFGSGLSTCSRPYCQRSSRSRPTHLHSISTGTACGAEHREAVHGASERHIRAVPESVQRGHDGHPADAGDRAVRSLLQQQRAGVDEARIRRAGDRRDAEGGKNWTVFGANSMQQVGAETACLAFVDGGAAAEAAVVIGGFQMEDNFLLFDAENSKLGYSSLLLGRMTTCANFNFTYGFD
uniref:Peptidase A1 domain-containing protein n=1 Tax=Ananas comosus var. bracteatus TaxID=296719 RepID=A0A6V7PBZ9_ANACO|nr:unnamed protein product [Ananas comosus var. bracteatus]